MTTLAEKTIRLSASLLKWQDKIEEALDKTGNQYSFDDVTALVITGDTHVYDWDDCLALMRISKTPQFSMYHCFIACGDLKALETHIKEIEEIAIKYGCAKTTYNGRLGWQKPMKAHGYTPTMVTMEKDLRHGKEG